MFCIVCLSFIFSGYEGLSTNPHLAYRNQMLPGLGFLLKKSFYLSHIKDNFSDCCMHRWVLNFLIQSE